MIRFRATLLSGLLLAAGATVSHAQRPIDSYKPCFDEPVFQQPTFVAPEFYKAEIETSERVKHTLEKPVFEVAKREEAKFERPSFEKPEIIRPEFDNCTEKRKRSNLEDVRLFAGVRKIDLKKPLPKQEIARVRMDSRALVATRR